MVIHCFEVLMPPFFIQNRMLGFVGFCHFNFAIPIPKFFRLCHLDSTRKFVQPFHIVLVIVMYLLFLVTVNTVQKFHVLAF